MRRSGSPPADQPVVEAQEVQPLASFDQRHDAGLRELGFQPELAVHDAGAGLRASVGSHRSDLTNRPISVRRSGPFKWVRGKKPQDSRTRLLPAFQEVGMPGALDQVQLRA
jgi:hypothetical protein